MLVVQQHLKNGVETLESLQDRFGIYHKIKDGIVKQMAIRFEDIEGEIIL